MSDARAGSAPRRPPPAGAVCVLKTTATSSIYIVNIAHTHRHTHTQRSSIVVRRVLRLIHSISPAAEFPVDSCVLLIEADVRRSGHVPDLHPLSWPAIKSVSFIKWQPSGFRARARVATSAQFGGKEKWPLGQQGRRARNKEDGRGMCLISEGPCFH